MKVLNLVNQEKSDIKYKISKFPDGQQNIVIKKGYFENDGIDKWFEKELPKNIQIKSRLNNWLDLELITCAVASLRELDVEKIHLYTPYFLGSRSDRKFEEGGNNYLKDVICPIINSLNFKTVTCIDPHSDVLEVCIKGFRKESNLELLKESLRQIYPGGNEAMDFDGLTDYILISPDAGASKKIYKLAEQIGYKGDIITCSKDRDADGKLTKTVVPISDLYSDSLKDHIIIDDICDGGATFINIAKTLKERYASMNNENMKGKIYLIVTHSIFSKGTNELLQYFDGIYTTNSYKEHNLEKIKVLNIF